MLRDFSLGMSSKDKGWAVGNSDGIRSAHNSFTRQDPFEIEYTKNTGKEEDAFHFISYVPFNGQLYELDGLQRGPISFGPCTEENWLTLARDQIMKRIQKYETSEIRFNLMALCADKKDQAEREVHRLSLIKTFLQHHLGQVSADTPALESLDLSSIQTEVNELSKQTHETMAASLREID